MMSTEQGLRVFKACTILLAVGGSGAAVVAGGFTREDFMNESFLRMTAVEQVSSLIFFLMTPHTVSTILSKLLEVANSRVMFLEFNY